MPWHSSSLLVAGTLSRPVATSPAPALCIVQLLSVPWPLATTRLCPLPLGVGTVPGKPLLSGEAAQSHDLRLMEGPGATAQGERRGCWNSLSLPGAQPDPQGALRGCVLSTLLSLWRVSEFFSQSLVLPNASRTTPASSLHLALHSCPFSSEPVFCPHRPGFPLFYAPHALGCRSYSAAPHPALELTWHQKPVSVNVLALRAPRSWAWMLASWLKGHPGPFSRLLPTLQRPEVQNHSCGDGSSPQA